MRETATRWVVLWGLAAGAAGCETSSVGCPKGFERIDSLCQRADAGAGLDASAGGRSAEGGSSDAEASEGRAQREAAATGPADAGDPETPASDTTALEGKDVAADDAAEVEVEGDDEDVSDPAAEVETEEDGDGTKPSPPPGVDDPESAPEPEWCFVDADGDGYGAGEAFDCLQGAGVNQDGDCDDSDASVSPEGEELCDGLDNDCDGKTDEDLFGYLDADGDGYGSEEELACEDWDPEDGEWLDVAGDCDDADAAVSPDAMEFCDGVDTDCDGFADRGTVNLCGGSCSGGQLAGAMDLGKRCSNGQIGECARDGVYECASGSSVSCNAPRVTPSAEVCDGLDNDCDGDVDEGSRDARMWYPDCDADGYAAPGAKGAAACGDSPPALLVDCKAWTARNPAEQSDCDDAAPKLVRSTPEVCDGVDNDCDGEVDESDSQDAVAWYRDCDGDGYASPDHPAVRSCGKPALAEGCKAWITRRPLDASSSDCNDGSGAAHPGADFQFAGTSREGDFNCDGRIELGTSFEATNPNTGEEQSYRICTTAEVTGVNQGRCPESLCVAFGSHGNYATTPSAACVVTEVAIGVMSPDACPFLAGSLGGGVACR